MYIYQEPLVPRESNKKKIFISPVNQYIYIYMCIQLQSSHSRGFQSLNWKSIRDTQPYTSCAWRTRSFQVRIPITIPPSRSAVPFRPSITIILRLPSPPLPSPPRSPIHTALRTPLRLTYIYIELNSPTDQPRGRIGFRTRGICRPIILIIIINFDSRQIERVTITRKRLKSKISNYNVM